MNATNMTDALLNALGIYGLEGLPLLVAQVAVGAILAAVIILVIALVTYYKRKFMGDAAVRIGPNRTGPFGILIWVADAIKLIQKEDIVHRDADPWVFNAGPIVMVTATVMTFAVVPFGYGLVFSNMDVGLVYLFAISELSLLGVIMAGYGSNNKWATISTLRAVLQTISYEITLIIAALGVVMVAGTFNLHEIVLAQEGTFFGILPRWFVFTQPVAFVLFTVAMFGEIMRNPFDLPEAESELVAGYYTEYSGFKFALIFFAEFGHMVLATFVLTTIFLGGWLGPSFLPGVLWFTVKAYFVLLLIFVMRMTHPRVRPDQMLQLGWKGLLELSFVNLVLTGVVLAVVA
ncbi:MAG: NADH-quinone oxidoreductase subunit H [Methanonatronarchaeales archaeon]|nr:NADH-quinone oxidoreductase subunit H [Methanonatronarchaeales archaeon]